MEELGYKQTAKHGFRRPKGKSGIQLTVELGMSRRHQRTMFQPSFNLICREVAAQMFTVIREIHPDADPKHMNKTGEVLALGLGAHMHDEDRKYSKLSWISEDDEQDDISDWFYAFRERVDQLTQRYKHLENDFLALEGVFTSPENSRSDRAFYLKAFHLAANVRPKEI
ncbi:MAG: hypothetical protein AAGJ84_10145 [Pseudomonadota bacterium]